MSLCQISAEPIGSPFIETAAAAVRRFPPVRSDENQEIIHTFLALVDNAAELDSPYAVLFVCACVCAPSVALHDRFITPLRKIACTGS